MRRIDWHPVALCLMLVGVLICLIAGDRDEASGQPKAKELPQPVGIEPWHMLKQCKYPVFVKVPYFRGIDELLYKDIMSGKLLLKPESGFRVEKGKLQMIVGRPGSKEAKWQDRDEVSLLAMYVFGNDKCYYDQNGNYFLEVSLYAQFKDRLIQHHKARLLILQDKDKQDHAYIYDEVDQCWRWPGLGIIEKDHVDVSGTKLYQKLLGGAPPRGTIEELHDKYLEKKVAGD